MPKPNHYDALLGKSINTVRQILQRYLPLPAFCRGYSFLHVLQTQSQDDFSFLSISVNDEPIFPDLGLGHNSSKERNVES